MTSPLELAMRSSRNLLLIAVVIGAIGTTLAQAPDTLWTRKYGGIYDNLPEKGCFTIDGQYAVAGSTNSYGSFDYNVALVRFNFNGDTLWTAYYGVPARADYGRALATTPDDGFIVAGTARVTDFQTYLIKTDSTGRSEWQKTFPTPIDAWPAGVICLPDTGILVGGYADNPTNPSNVDFYAIRTKPNGDTLWTRMYGTPLEEYATAACATPDSGMILVGYLIQSGTADRDVYAVRIRSNGDTAWTKTYGGTTWEEALSIIPMSDGSYLIAGYQIVSPGGENVLLLKIDGNGATMWASAIGGSDNERAYDVDETLDHGFVVGGRINVSGRSHQMLLLKADATGALEWSTHCGGTGIEFATFVHQNGDGTFLLAGRTNSNTGGYYKYYLAKYTAAVTDVHGVRRFTPERFCLYQNFPNPFNPATTIEFDIPERTLARLAIYDLLGQEVASLVSAELVAGRHRFTWYASGIPSGVYVVRLDAGSWTSSRKLILLR